MSTKPVAPRLVELAAITGAHGVTGEVRLKLFGEGVESLKALKSVRAGESGAVLSLAKVRSDNKGGAIARFAEIRDRTGAEALRGTVLTVSRNDLPALDEGEFYLADLIGLTAVTSSGRAVGTVVAVENFGATDIVEIEKSPVPAKGMKSFMVPLTKAAVPEWDDTRLVIADDFADD